MSEINENITIDVEINKNISCSYTTDCIVENVKKYFQDVGKITPGSIIKDETISTYAHFIRVCEYSKENFNYKAMPISNVNISYFVFELNEDGGQKEHLEPEDEEEASPCGAQNWVLPSKDFDSLWDSLVFDEDIKGKVLDYIQISQKFAEAGIDKSIIAWNNVVLFHGPPGTGKTTLCKALAQKLSIRLSNTITHGQLVEINAHSLFSKWFSESGKLVLKMFEKIREWVVDSSGFVFILIDEVESLTHSRAATMNNAEPSDSLRVVNAVLTQLDKMKEYPNVLILATSNLGNAIDIAFADRADLKQYIGPPSKLAVYKIYKSCIEELIRTKLILAKSNDILDLSAYLLVNNIKLETLGCSNRLYDISVESEGLSGRVLRKLPFLAYSLLRKRNVVGTPSLNTFLDCLSEAVIKHKTDTQLFINTSAENLSS